MANKYQQQNYAQTNDKAVSVVKQIGNGNGVIIEGTKYILGDTVVVGNCDDNGQPIFGRLTGFDIVENDVIFVAKKYVCHFNSHYHAHEVEYLSGDICTINHSVLRYDLPVSMVHSDFTGDHICVRHSVF